MQKLISYPISVIYYLVFGFLLCVFHPIQWFCFNVFGYQAHKKSVDILNFFLLRTTHIVGSSYHFNNRHLIPKGVPIIFVANHQSMYDIIPMIWFFRKSHAKFISKKELGRGVPSVSYNLRHGGSALIDRKDPKQALAAIRDVALYVEKNQRSVVIFPEGTRSKDGIPKKFSENGLKIIFKYAQSSVVVPISINNSWKMVRYGFFPMGLGSKITFTIHESFPVKGETIENLIIKTETAVKSGIKN
jgi:1-acyl-sn-glycerol-3-phosphate acyltransferase